MRSNINHIVYGDFMTVNVYVLLHVEHSGHK